MSFSDAPVPVHIPVVAANGACMGFGGLSHFAGRSRGLAGHSIVGLLPATSFAPAAGCRQIVKRFRQLAPGSVSCAHSCVASVAESRHAPLAQSLQLITELPPRGSNQAHTRTTLRKYLRILG